MMKSSSFFALVILLLVLVNQSFAVESDPKGGLVGTESTNKDPDVDSGGLKLPPPDHDKETKASDSDVKEDPKETKTKEEKKPKGEEEKGGLEECDPANRCIDEKSEFVACLRVPGKDSLDLSLLIQNKGKGSLDINITAPDAVVLEQNKVQVDAKSNKEVKVSVKEGENNTMIVLKAGKGDCKLDFGNMISNSFKKSEDPASSRYLTRISTRNSLAFILVVASLILGVAWLCIKFWRMKKNDGISSYQKMEVGLPISTGGNKEPDVADGWDSGWGDDWDDEEAAPVTPSKPSSTPSSNGLASRKSSKDAWKD